MGSITEGLTTLGAGIGSRLNKKRDIEDFKEKERAKLELKREAEKMDREDEAKRLIAIAEAGGFEDTGLDVNSIKQMIKSDIVDEDRIRSLARNKRINALENQKVDADILRTFNEQSREAAQQGMSLARPDFVKEAIRRQSLDPFKENIDNVDAGSKEELARLIKRKQFSDKLSREIAQEERTIEKEDRDFNLREKESNADLLIKDIELKSKKLQMQQQKENMNILDAKSLQEGIGFIESLQSKTGEEFGSGTEKISFLKSFFTPFVNPLLLKTFFGGKRDATSEDIVFATELSKLLRSRGERDFSKLSKGRKITDQQLKLFMEARNLTKDEAKKELGIDEAQKTKSFKIGL